jgi:hypothetical protein
MKDSDSFINEQHVDWSLTTWEGARREQLRRWAALPLERAIMALEEMEALARELQAGPAESPMPSNRLEHCPAPPGSGSENI